MKIKLTTILLMLLLVSTLAVAEEEKEDDITSLDFCVEYSSKAREFMQLRQENTPISIVLTALEDLKLDDDYAKYLLIKAYQEPVYSLNDYSKKYVDRIVEAFESHVFHQCMRVEDEK